VQWIQELQGKDDASETPELCPQVTYSEETDDEKDCPDDASETPELCPQVTYSEETDDENDCPDLSFTQESLVQEVKDQVAKIDLAWDLLRTSHKGSRADAIWHLIFHIPGMGGTGFRAAQLAMDQDGWDLLVCGAGSLQAACRLTKIQHLDTNAKIPSRPKRFKSDTSALERRLQYLRVQVIHDAITRTHAHRYAGCYEADVLARTFRSVTATQFLLCEYGKSLSPQSREWYIKSPQERVQLAETFAAMSFAEVTFN
jgi:hypothetical protein